MVSYSNRTGEVFIRNFDKGMVEYILGGVVQVGPIDKKNNYYVSIPGANPLLVPIIFDKPEQIFENKILPLIHVAREEPVPALQRWKSVAQIEYLAGVTGAGIMSVVQGGKTITGYSELEYKAQAWPYDITYRISVHARFEHEAISILRFILRRCQVHGRVKVIDSLNEVRYYSTYTEGGIGDIGEIVDVLNRVKGYTISLRVEGELDLYDPQLITAVSGFVINAN